MSLPSPCYCRTASTSCTLCRGECKTCEGQGLIHCASCYDNASVNPFSKKCYCNDGFFANPDVMHCTVCHPTCLTCYGVNSDSCLSFPEHATISGRSCACTGRYFLDESTQRCTICPDYCELCQSGYCYQCVYGFGLDNDHICMLLDGYALDEATNTAFVCSFGCKHCTYHTSEYIWCTTCTECFAGSVTGSELTSTVECVCPISQYFEPSINSCTSCLDSKCLHCHLPSSATPVRTLSLLNHLRSCALAK